MSPAVHALPLAVADHELTAIALIVVVGALLMLVVHEVFALARARIRHPDAPGEHRDGAGGPPPEGP